MKLTLTWVGQPKDTQTKFGLKQKFSIKATEYADKYLDVWSSPVTKNWKVGDVVEVLEVTTREYNGKDYYSVVMPKANHGDNTEVMKKLEFVQGQNTKILLFMAELVDHKRTQTGENKPKIMGTDEDYPVLEHMPDFGEATGKDTSEIPF